MTVVGVGGVVLWVWVWMGGVCVVGDSGGCWQHAWCYEVGVGVKGVDVVVVSVGCDKGECWRREN